MFLENNEWEVLTDEGWSDFSALKIGRGAFVSISFSNQESIRVTADHLLMTADGWVAAKNINVGDNVKSIDGFIDVISINDGGEGETFDLVGVKKNSRYFTNDVLSHNCDEFAHLAPKLAEEFIASVFPTISSSMESKLIIVSTPKGMNQFYKLWVDAENGKNGFITVEGKWREHPKRNQKWADEQLAILGPVKYKQEVECLWGKSKITLRDVVTGEILNVSLEEAYDLIC